MSTHANIYVPITLDGKDIYLHCEASSDGDFDGVGYALLASSKHMEDIIKLNTIFAGAPFYYDFESKKIHPINDGIDYVFFNSSSSLFDSALECLSFFNQNQLDQVYQSNFAKIGLNEKLDEGFGFGDCSEINNLDNILTNSQVVTNIDEIKQFLKSNGQEDLHYIESWEHLYYDNQWLIKLYDDEREKSIYIPMITALLNFTNVSQEGYRAGTIADPFNYIENGLTEKDLYTLNQLYQHNIENNFDMKSHGWGNVWECIEKMQLDKTIKENVDSKNNKIKL
jgi:hypothetical protein